MTGSGGPETARTLTLEGSQQSADHERESLGPPAFVFGSGKGGVGKSVASIAFAAALADEGRRVLLLDGDQNMGCLHVLLGIRPTATLETLLNAEATVSDLVESVCPNLWLLPSESGAATLYGLTPLDRARLHRQLSLAYDDYDVVVIDAGAGLDSAMRCAAMRATRLVLVTMAEPAALNDAFALARLVSMQVPALPIDTLINRAATEEEGRVAHRRLATATERYLARDTRALGVVLEDPGMREAIRDPARLLARDGSPALTTMWTLAQHNLGLGAVSRAAEARSA